MGELRQAGPAALAGTRPAGSAFQTPDSAVNMTGGAGGTRPALESTGEYTGGERAKKCASNDDTCNGWRVLGSPHCTVHLKQLGKLGEWQERAKRLKELKAEQTSDELE